VITRRKVDDLLRVGHSCETAARVLDVPPGLVFMVATGLAADDGDPPPGERLDLALAGAASSQQLINPPVYNPVRNERVRAWVRERAREALEQPR
jgi:hypothetical protein